MKQNQMNRWRCHGVAMYNVLIDQIAECRLIVNGGEFVARCLLIDLMGGKKPSGRRGGGDSWPPVKWKLGQKKPKKKDSSTCSARFFTSLFPVWSRSQVFDNNWWPSYIGIKSASARSASSTFIVCIFFFFTCWTAQEVAIYNDTIYRN